MTRVNVRFRIRPIDCLLITAIKSQETEPVLYSGLGSDVTLRLVLGLESGLECDLWLGSSLRLGLESGLGLLLEIATVYSSG